MSAFSDLSEDFASDLVKADSANEKCEIKTIYIAGPMRGYKYFNFPAFFKAASELEGHGWLLVVSPADLDIQFACLNPFDRSIIPDPDAYDWSDLKRIGFSLSDAVKRDVEALTKCDAIYLLEGWENSKGAKAEKAVVEWLGLEVFYQIDIKEKVGKLAKALNVRFENVTSQFGEVRKVPHE